MSDHTTFEKFLFIYSIILWTATLSFTVLVSFFYTDATPIILILLVIATFTAYGATIYSFKERITDKNANFILIKVRDKILPIKLIFIGSIIFFPVNFIIGMVFLWEGSPSIIEGVYWLTNHGDLVREISEAEYLRLSMAEMRLMSGCLLTFIAMPVAHFGIKKRQKQ